MRIRDAKHLSSPEPEGMPFVKMLEQAETLVLFSQAQRVAHGTELTRFNTEAFDYVNQHADDPVCWMVPCMLCGKPFEFWTTVKVSVELLDMPRGICGDHDKGGVSAVVIEG